VNDPKQRKQATSHTIERLRAVSVEMDPADWERASRGLVGQIASGKIAVGNHVVWDVAKYDFLRNETAPPETVNPSLWQHARLDAMHGLFAVAPNVWQARGYDISNITFIAGASGWILIDVLSTESTARACLELANAELGERPVVAVIYTHSHADHFGGVLGVTTQADVDAGRCIIVAPEGFLHETVAENVVAGPAMLRRAAYQFGPLLPPGPKGHVDCGLGVAMPLGFSGLIAPTHNIQSTGEEMTIDGVRIVFQMTPESEAPAEMNFFFPDHGWLCMAENCAHTMHNLVPIRGAQVRNALAWSKYIGEAIELFGDQTSLMFTSHHWPRWGNDDVSAFLILQRDLYRWMHDQTMRYANLGYTASEIAELLELPPEFTAESHTRGYYGSLVHNVKAVYQRYLSWYDGNPARLHSLPPQQAGQRYVAFMGGADELLPKAQASFDRGDYRWVAEVVNHLVFADPTNQAARHLQADALEQLGYQSESSTFRNAYLTGAQELRDGSPVPRPAVSRGLLPAMSVELLFDSLAVRLKADQLAGFSTSLDMRFTDVNEQWILRVTNRTLHATKNATVALPDAVVTTSRTTLIDLAMGDRTLDAAIADGSIALTGDGRGLATIFANLENFMTGFNIIEP
jgi:alkyl sulfatase BDS1-like metallo-beta-lactamase superfamily hydrolase